MLYQRPEYVCTCCHCMLFCKTVQQFNITDYDMSNETVKECLSHWYVMKLHRHTSHENDEMSTHKWPQFVPDDAEHDIYVMNEFICICCRNSLRQKKKQRCLTRHVQMVFSYMTSHRIYSTYCHWRERVISPQIPFITILVIRWYGGHYKVNGPPVNVPATLD